MLFLFIYLFLYLFILQGRLFSRSMPPFMPVRLTFFLVLLVPRVGHPFKSYLYLELAIPLSLTCT